MVQLPDPKERFTATVEAYAQHRPGYPDAVIDWLISTAALEPGATVVDLGAGTGISARLFAARGFDVIGVEPNEAMLERARAAGGGPRYVLGEAAGTGLEAGRASLVFGAQAFHWFDLERTFPELARILVPGGWCAAFWNVREDAGFTRDYTDLLESLAEYHSTPKPEAVIAAIEARPEPRDLRAFEAPNAQSLDLDGLIGRAFSSSYVAHASRSRADLTAALEALFARHQQGGRVELAYRTVVRAWHF